MRALLFGLVCTLWLLAWPCSAFCQSASTKPAAAVAGEESPLDHRLPQLDAAGLPLEQVIGRIRQLSGANVFVSWHALESVGIDRNTPVTVALRDVRARKALHTIVGSLAGANAKVAGWEEGDTFIIGVSAQVTSLMTLRVHYTRDLLIDAMDCWPAPNAPPPPKYGRAWDELAKLIVDVVARDSWSQNAGPGRIYAWQGWCIVYQTPEAHCSLTGLIDQLRQERSDPKLAPSTQPAARPYAVQVALERPVAHLQWSDQSLRSVIDRIQTEDGPIEVRWPAMEKLGIKADTVVDVDLQSTSRAAALRLVLCDLAPDQVDYGFEVAPREKLVISTRADFNANPVKRRYSLADLLPLLPPDAAPPRHGLGDLAKTIKEIARVADAPGAPATCAIDTFGDQWEITAPLHLHRRIAELLAELR